MQNNILNRKFRYTYSNASAWLVGINFAVFLIVTFTNIRIRGVPLIYWLSIVPPFISRGCVWQFVTYMFVHSGFFHIFFNMYALFIFGSRLERAVGTREFLLFYFVTGILGGVLCWLISVLTGMTNVAILGASGAVYGLLFLTSVMYPYDRILLFFFIPMRMPVAVLVFIAIEIISQITGTTAGISHLVHLSSILVAWVYCLLRFRISPVKVWKEALHR